MGGAPHLIRCRREGTDRLTCRLLAWDAGGIVVRAGQVSEQLRGDGHFFSAKPDAKYFRLRGHVVSVASAQFRQHSRSRDDNFKVRMLLLALERYVFIMKTGKGNYLIISANPRTPTSSWSPSRGCTRQPLHKRSGQDCRPLLPNHGHV